MFLLTRKSFTLIFHLPNLLMFFRAQGSNQVDLVEHLVRAQVVKTPAVKRVLGIVDRKNYAGESAWGPSEQYLDSPLPIQCGQTISAPHMHGYAMEE